jgi:hypothetical protein
VSDGSAATNPVITSPAVMVFMIAHSLSLVRRDCGGSSSQLRSI